MFALGLALLICLSSGWLGVVPAGAQMEIPPPADLPVAILPASPIEKKAIPPAPRFSSSRTPNAAKVQPPVAKGQPSPKKESPKQKIAARKNPRTLTLAKAEGQMRSKSISRQGKAARDLGRPAKKGSSKSTAGGR